MVDDSGGATLIVVFCGAAAGCELLGTITLTSVFSCLGVCDCGTSTLTLTLGALCGRTGTTAGTGTRSTVLDLNNKNLVRYSQILTSVVQKYH
ncbi:hypothetical protein H6G06_19410 [Anabaena sphaerica FACHB-251]|uniref:Uncharacterized protein n=1 Tax=Anabaena sphaerica FACHB-251 TaxID=2692883 RepID=A0A927A3E2_9NOST|nr:hypothetical protein [Anabaena sphaerica FACHB-251]